MYDTKISYSLIKMLPCDKCSGLTIFENFIGNDYQCYMSEMFVIYRMLFSYLFLEEHKI